MSRKIIDIEKKKIGDKIKYFRKKKNFTLQQLADILSTSSGYLSEIETGKTTPGSKFLLSMKRNFDIDLNWLFLEKEFISSDVQTKYPEAIALPEMEVAESVEECGNFVFVPQVSDRISAGEGYVPYNAVEVRIAFKKDWIKKKGDPRRMALIKVSGDSMEPTLLSGDLALVSHEQNYVDPQGGIYAISMDDLIMVKRLQLIYQEKKIKIISDNKKYEAEMAEADQVKINGRVIWFGREIDK